MKYFYYMIGLICIASVTGCESPGLGISTNYYEVQKNCLLLPPDFTQMPPKKVNKNKSVDSKNSGEIENVKDTK